MFRLFTFWAKNWSLFKKKLREDTKAAKDAHDARMKEIVESL